MNTYVGGAFDVASLGLTFFNLDSSGHLMKLSQMQKTYCRMRFIDIHHGPYLSSYFEYSSKKTDSQTNLQANEIQSMSSRFYSNMVYYRVSFDIFEMDLIRSVFYGVSWIFKIISYCLIHLGIKNRALVKKGVCYFVLISQKIHMIALNVIAVDLIPYAERALFQASEISLLIRIASAILLSLLICDFCEIYQIGGNSKLTEYQENDELLGLRENSVIGIDKS